MNAEIQDCELWDNNNLHSMPPRLKATNVLFPTTNGENASGQASELVERSLIDR